MKDTARANTSTCAAREEGEACLSVYLQWRCKRIGVAQAKPHSGWQSVDAGDVCPPLAPGLVCMKHLENKSPVLSARLLSLKSDPNSRLATFDTWD